MGERRIGGLGESGKPLLVPGIEPVLGIVGGKENVKVRIERITGKAH
jgi:hypothetical protein